MLQQLSRHTRTHLKEALSLHDESITEDEFAKGVVRELQHLCKHRLVNLDSRQRQLLAAKMAVVHLQCIPDYYTRLERMEADARAYHFGVR